MEGHVAHRGYDLQSAFTEDLSYGETCCIKATNGGKTMCVAAVTEVFVRALDAYASTGAPQRAFKELPIDSWTGSKYLNIRPHLFQYAEARSHGPGDALSRFGIGEAVAFEKLKAGDALAFSRMNGTGHAVIFLAYIDDRNQETAKFSDSTIGFSYFSAQKSTDGIGKRAAYFGTLASPRCPDFAKQGSDCGVIQHAFLNAGRLWNPSAWDVNAAVERLKKQRASDLTRAAPTASVTEIKASLEKNLLPEFSVDFSE